MISPGKWHLLIPRDPVANVKWRKALLERAAGDKDFQRGIIEICRQDVIFFCCAFLWQFNPNVRDKTKAIVGPFISYPYQDQAMLDTPETTGKKGLLWCYENGEPCVLEKSRDLGATWWLLILIVWLCVFFRDQQFNLMSHNDDAVDNGTRNSLFGKMRFINEHLPEWLRGEVDETKHFIRWERTKSEALGAASTSKSHTGGRGCGFVDEFGQIEQDKAVRENMSNVGDCIFYVSTHYGTGTEFYRMTLDKNINKIVWHWTQHPLKNQGLYRYVRQDSSVKQKFYQYDPDKRTLVESPNQHKYAPDFHFCTDAAPKGGPWPGVRSPWYDKKARSIGNSRGVAMHLDIDPAGSIAQVFDALIIAELREYCRPPTWEGDIEYDQLGNFEGWIKSKGGPLRFWGDLDEKGDPSILTAPYGAGADCAGGRAKTPSCLSIANCVTGEKVCEYGNANIEPNDFGVLASALLRRFKDDDGTEPRIAWEHAGPGTNFFGGMQDCGYRNFCRPVQEDRPGKPKKLAYGWTGVGGAAAKMIRYYADSLYHREFINPSDRALDETLVFTYDARGRPVHSLIASKDDPSGAHESHGDYVVADGLANMIVRQSGKLQTWRTIREEEMRQAEEDPDPRTFDGRTKLWEREEAVCDQIRQAPWW